MRWLVVEEVSHSSDNIDFATVVCVFDVCGLLKELHDTVDSQLFLISPIEATGQLPSVFKFEHITVLVQQEELRGFRAGNNLQTLEVFCNERVQLPIRNTFNRVDGQVERVGSVALEAENQCGAHGHISFH